MQRFFFFIDEFWALYNHKNLTIYYHELQKKIIFSYKNFQDYQISQTPEEVH